MGRVVITGAGAVSPIGNNFEEVMEGIRDGKRGIGTIQSIDTCHLPGNVGAEVRENGKPLLTESHIDRKEIFITRAVDELIKNCRSIHRYPPEKRFIHIGAGHDYLDLIGYTNSNDKVTGKWIDYSKSGHIIVKGLAKTNEIKGGFSVNVTTCVAATQAMGTSFRLLKRLSAGNVIITGGFDSVINHLHYMAFYKLGAMSKWKGEPGHACRPFDKNRSGLVLGEGAGVFLLQDAEDVFAGEGLAEIVGYSSTMDAYKVTDPHPEGKYLARAAINAIEEAGLRSADIDCVHLHGTGTYKNAIAETNAMRQIFPERWAEIPVFSMKGQIGHLIGACGALEMIGVIYSLKYQQVPPTVNFEEQAPEAPLLVIKDKPLHMKIDHVLKLNSAFGGQNSALVVKRYVE
jgi:3-oxoacyl-[acyl-carrier-protein] synthase II